MAIFKKLHMCFVNDNIIHLHAIYRHKLINLLKRFTYTKVINNLLVHLREIFRHMLRNVTYLK